MLLTLACVASSYALDANADNGIRGISMSINPARMHRSGEVVTFNIMIDNGNTKDEKAVNISFYDSEAIIDGEGEHRLNSTQSTPILNLPAEETVALKAWITRIPLNAEKITSMQIVGRAPESSKSTSANPYGDYSYRFRNLPLPEFPESNRRGCVFFDNEISLHVGDIYASGKDLVVDFTLTNNGGKDYTINAADFGRGVARTAEGDEYVVSTKISKNLMVGEPVKGQIVITDGANKTFISVRQGFDLYQNGSSWRPGLLLRNISNR